MTLTALLRKEGENVKRSRMQRTGLMVLAMVFAAFAWGGDEDSVNCDSEISLIDLERCDSARASILQTDTPAQYCMGGPCCTHTMRPCTQASNQHIATATQIVRGSRLFCEQYLKDRYQFANLSLQHAVTQAEAREHVRSVIGGNGNEGDVHPWAARMDLNNDGRREYITWLSMYSGAGRGCDVEFYVELDPRGKIRKNGISPLLRPTRCGDRFRAIEYRGKVYLEKRKTTRSVEGFVDVTQELRMLEGTRNRLVCKFAFVWDRIK